MKQRGRGNENSRVPSSCLEHKTLKQTLYMYCVYVICCYHLCSVLLLKNEALS